MAAGLVGMSNPAAALIIKPFFIKPVQITGGVLPDQCDPLPVQQKPVTEIIGFEQTPQMIKSSAILGGQMSALERIRQDQQGLVLAPSLPLVQVSLQAATGTSKPSGDVATAVMVPGVGGDSCNRFALPRAVAPVGAGRGTGRDDFLLTKRLPVSRTAFDTEWDRVRSAGLSSRTVHNLLPRQFRTGQIDFASVEGVNAWTNHKIRYAEDAKLFGRADYWAGAQATLRLRAGDCEDIAITKMQILAAMGLPRTDMFLTIARDLARHADHALLVVRIDNRYWVLDNAADRLLDADERLDYQPVLSFSAGHKWLHGAVSVAVN